MSNAFTLLGQSVNFECRHNIYIMSYYSTQGDEKGLCAFLTYFIMAGYQFKQAQAVIMRVVS